ncbi:MAG: 16S rRNA (guanine(527)-N(7))-methyltransferase RsmG [Mariniphaga sp.]|jgi:16S rRNA (guanine527-N7)-methyltransferase|nr:16S rRNA (guanine(527)-N(7))-methyltransferase RsmG [Mariniphaga sp.]
MDIILRYFSRLTPEQVSKLNRLFPVYSEWNAKINVISRKDIDQLYERHVLHSLAVAKFIRFTSGSKILDVGTGGGFPGIPLAILFPECQFHLVDSIGKKIKVVNEVVRVLDLKNVRAEQIRAEQLKDKYDFVISRAVTTLPEFVGWVRKNISPVQQNALPNGIIYLKGGNLDAEIRPYRNNAFIQDITEYFEEEFFKTKKLVYIPF